MITDYIPVGHKNAVTRKYLVCVTGLSDRRVRREIHLARREMPIINSQDGKGYFVPDTNDPVDMSLLRAFVKQEESRLKSIGWALKPARAMAGGKHEES